MQPKRQLNKSSDLPFTKEAPKGSMPEAAATVLFFTCEDTSLPWPCATGNEHGLFVSQHSSGAELRTVARARAIATVQY